jgi:glutaredoxin
MRAKQYLENNNIAFREVNIEEDEQAREFMLGQGHRTVPQIYLGDTLFVAGGWEGLSKLSPAEIHQRINPTNLGTL